jgi:hypothetical protein
MYPMLWMSHHFLFCATYYVLDLPTLIDLPTALSGLPDFPGVDLLDFGFFSLLRLRVGFVVGTRDFSNGL